VNLYIHVGTEKTASSFLQKVCGHNRDLLEGNGIWFPYAGKHEPRLMSGTISPGNAVELQQLIHAADWSRVTDWVARRVSEASERGCEALLLSNEVLFSALSEQASASCFEAAVHDAGVAQVEAMLFIRDPVDQALSLYKHRAKSGKVDRIESWVRSDFVLPRQIESLLSQMEQSTVNLTIRKYFPDTARLLQIFFRDWLKLEGTPRIPEEVVNPSLTLSELAIVRGIAMTRPLSVPFFYEQLVALPRSSKADDDRLEEAARKTLSSHLSEFDSVWRDLDRRLESDGGLAIPMATTDAADHEASYSFSASQLQALATAHDRSLSLHGRTNLWIQTRLRPLLGRMLARLRGGRSES
jgi:hypothetical protein